MTALVSIENLHVERGGYPAVIDFSYKVAKPGWTGIIGANGSGKTSLLSAIAGRFPVKSGRILIEGVDVTHDRAARARQIGFAVEGRLLPDELSAREVFGIASERRGAIDAAELGELRSALNFERFIDRRCSALSSGMRQRVALFAAFLDLPKIVILDEPFNWLDAVTAFDVKSALTALVAKQQIALVTALHDISTMTASCQEGALMSGGRIAMIMKEADLRAGLNDPVTFEATMVQKLRTG